MRLGVLAVVALATAVAGLAAACGGGEQAAPPAESAGGGTTPQAAAPPASTGDAEITYVLYDVHPDSPVVAEIGLTGGDTGVERIVLLGTKDADGVGVGTVEAIELYGPEPDPTVVTVGADGSPVRVAAPDGTIVEVLDVAGGKATLEIRRPDGSSDVVTKELGAASTSAPAGGEQHALLAGDVRLYPPVAWAETVSRVTVSVTTSGAPFDYGLLRLITRCDSPDADVRCRASVGPDGTTISVTSAARVDVPADAPARVYETAKDCEQDNFTVGEVLLSAGSLALAVSAVDPPLGALIGLVGFVGDAVVQYTQPNCSSIYTNAGLSRDALDRKAGVTVKLIVDAVAADRYAISPSGSTLELQPLLPVSRGATVGNIQLTAVPLEDEDAATEPTGTELDGHYEGNFVLPEPLPAGAEVHIDSFTLDVESGQVSGSLYYEVQLVPTVEGTEITGDACTVFSADFGPNDVVLDPETGALSGGVKLGIAFDFTTCANVPAPTFNPVEASGEIAGGTATLVLSATEEGETTTLTWRATRQ